ncbi:hypothetical protein Lal_00022862 [Lupinus albus]|nr:hypothetical protein Lal_00022862 [Lupinus albus]
MPMISFYMQGEVLSWFKWVFLNSQLSDWKTFTRDLENRFAIWIRGGISTTIWKSCITKFGAYLLKLFSTVLFQGCCQKFAVSWPSSNQPPFPRLWDLQNWWKLRSVIMTRLSFPHAPTYTKTTTHHHSNSQPDSPKPSLPIRRLTIAQIQDRHAQGLCYNCNEFFYPSHQCQVKKFLLIENPRSMEYTECFSLGQEGLTQAKGLVFAPRISLGLSPDREGSCGGCKVLAWARIGSPEREECCRGWRILA